MFLFSSTKAASLCSKLRRFTKSASLKNSSFKPVRRVFGTESFLGGSNGNYVDEMFAAWKQDPKSVHTSWDAYFRTGSFDAPPAIQTGSAPVPSGSSQGSVDQKMLLDTFKVMQLIRAFEVRGHFKASLDPLQLRKTWNRQMLPEELSLAFYGFTDADLDRTFDLGHLLHVRGFLGQERGKMTLREIHDRLTDVYCGNIAVEYMHIPSVQQCNWIRGHFETVKKFNFSKEDKLKILERLTWGDHFERFAAKKYSTHKRFGLEGAEALIPGMKALIDTCSELGTEQIVFGMPHRGRLNVLSTVVRKPIEQIFAEFADIPQSDSIGSGDVKYHLGMSHQRTLRNGKNVHLSLVANPSHLEAVNPVVCGKVRAKQFYANDTDRTKAVAVLLHGDAAFSGQGVVYETMGMSDLPDYTTGGVVHIVVNNQIGFTTDPYVSRSSPYCTDIAKAFNLPIFHVNGNDPEAVVRVCQIAALWRQEFKVDVVVDMVCYRKHGHNEIDEPMFTQPRMYTKIAQTPSVLEVYTKQLIDNGTLKAEEAKAISDTVWKYLEDKFAASKSFKQETSDWLETNWRGLKGPREYSPPVATGIKEDLLKTIGKKLVDLPKGFNLHRRLKPIMKRKEEMIETGQGIDWGTGEALAFGSLLLEGHHVRLSGQDVERGTFSHRHAVLHDQVDFEKPAFRPLNNLSPQQAFFSVSNSHLSEFGVLGFELGYSYENPNALVLWEAQFGDFANGAQVIIDQFLSSAEDKWLRQSGLVMLLPHGYEGAGPEHSSARLERYLQGSNDHPLKVPEMDPSKSMQAQQTNWQVLNCTTPANYFHALRRQIVRQFRKPMIVMSPKLLLRHPLAVSPLSDMVEGTRFQRVIKDSGKGLVAESKVRKLIFCSGKVYYDLLEFRNKHEIKDVALTRVEQLTPFPFDRVLEEAKRFKNAQIVWCQEEPMNMGAYTYVAPRIETAVRELKDIRVAYVGRDPAASTATGSHHTHDVELETFLKQAFE